jgi:peptidoglycan-associated lipoprotein
MRMHRWVVPVLLAGCSSTELREPGPPAPGTTASSAAATALEASARSQASAKTATPHPLDDPKSGLVTRSVFFAFNSHRLPESDRPLLEAHAKYLRANPSAVVRIEGNCDERGGRAVNLTLGQRRAEAVRAALRLLGVPDAQMEVVSFGKQRPVDLRHHETAWAQNRRVNLNYARR